MSENSETEAGATIQALETVSEIAGAESDAARTVEIISDIAAETVADAEARADNAEQIAEAIIASATDSEFYRRLEETEGRLWNRLNEVADGLESLRSDHLTLQSQLTELVSTLAAATLANPEPAQQSTPAPSENTSTETVPIVEPQAIVEAPPVAEASPPVAAVKQRVRKLL